MTTEKITMTRRGVLGGLAASLALAASPVTAQQRDLNYHIRRSTNAFRQVLRDRRFGNELINYMTNNANDTGAFQQDRINSASIVLTFSSIENGQFYTMTETDQIHVMRCALKQTVDIMNFIHSVVVQEGTNSQESFLRNGHNTLRARYIEMDPLFVGANETCNSVYRRTIARLQR